MKRKKIAGIIIAVALVSGGAVATPTIIAHAETTNNAEYYMQEASKTTLEKAVVNTKAEIKDEGKTIGYANKYDMAVIEEKGDTTYKVVTEFGLKGTIDKQALTMIKDSSNDKLIEMNSDGHVVNVTTVLRFREGATLKSKIIFNLKNGANFKIVGKQGEWYKIKIDNKVGFVYGMFVETGYNKNAPQKAIVENKENDSKGTIAKIKSNVSKSSVATESKDNGSKSSVATESKDNGSKGSVATESKDNGSKGSVATESKDNGSKSSVATESKDSGSKGSVATENKDNGSKGSVTTENKDSSSKGSVTEHKEKPQEKPHKEKPQEKPHKEKPQEKPQEKPHKERTVQNMPQLAQETFNQLNQFREKNGLKPLKYSSTSANRAVARAKYNAENNTATHNPGQIGLYNSVGSAQSFINQWASSPNHKKDMLTTTYTGAGVGVYKDSNGRYFAVIDFYNDFWN